MVRFKNRYLVLEVILDPNKDLATDDPIIITQYNVSKAIKDCILLNFGECGFAFSLGSFQVSYVNPITKLCIIRAFREDYQKVWAAITMVRTISNCPVLFNLLDLTGNTRACKNTALRLDIMKFELYELMVGAHLHDVNLQMQSCLEKIITLRSDCQVCVSLLRETLAADSLLNSKTFLLLALGAPLYKLCNDTVVSFVSSFHLHSTI